MVTWFLINSWIMIHFGRNPESGGRPPSDISVISVAEIISGVLFHRVDRESVVVLLFK